MKGAAQFIIDIFAGALILVLMFIICVVSKDHTWNPRSGGDEL